MDWKDKVTKGPSICTSAGMHIQETRPGMHLWANIYKIIPSSQHHDVERFSVRRVNCCSIQKNKKQKHFHAPLCNKVGLLIWCDVLWKFHVGWSSSKLLDRGDCLNPTGSKGKSKTLCLFLRENPLTHPGVVSLQPSVAKWPSRRPML